MFIQRHADSEFICDLIHLVKASCFHYNQVNITAEIGLYNDRQSDQSFGKRP